MDISSVSAFVLWKTRYACALGSNELNLHFLGSLCALNAVDLRILLKKHHADEMDLVVWMPDLTATFLTRLCAKSLTCPFSFGCIKLNDSFASLGSNLNSSQVVDPESGNIRMFFDQGDSCHTGNASYSFEVVFKCWRDQEGQLTFLRRSESGCHFHFEWLTRHVCVPSPLDDVSSQSCRIGMPNLDKDTNLNNKYEYFTYDFSMLKKNVYEFDSYSVAVCASLPSQCNFINSSSVCLNSSISQGSVFLFT